MSRRQKFFLGSLIISLVVGLWFFGGLAVQAQTTTDLGVNYAAATGLTDKDPRLVVANIVKIALGFLGTIAVVLVIYAGFLWMTAAGNEDKIKRAKDILKAGVIGLAIILSAFAITSFIINSLLAATNDNGGNNGINPPNILPPAVMSEDFRIVNSSPAAGATNLPRNTVVKFRFNRSVNSASVTNQSATVSTNGQPVAGQWTVSGSEIVFQPDEICHGSCGEVHCLPENGQFEVQLSTNIQSSETEPKSLVCGGSLDSACTKTFSTGSTIDCQDPQASFVSTVGLCAGVNNHLQVQASDDSGLTSFEFLANNQTISLQTGSFGTNHLAGADWLPSDVAGANFTLQTKVDDLAGHRVTASQNGKLLPAHCCNAVQDGNETGLDCGGDCLGCQGSACANDRQSPAATCNNNLCSSGFCTQQGSSEAACEAAGYAAGTASCCLCKNKPQIVSLSPRGGFCSNDQDQYCNVDGDCGSGNSCDQNTPNAKVGNLMTIIGSGFGSATGSVTFADNRLGNLAACGVDAWSNNQIVVQVPTGATNGQVKVTNSDNLTAISSQSVTINNLLRPGLCSLSKASGTTNELIDYQGLNFGTTSNALAKAFYGSNLNPIPTNESQAVSSNLVRARVPGLQNGQVTTFVSNNGPASNYLLFNKTVDPGSLPQITGFEPSSGPVGQYVTIYGRGFGNLRGQSKVLFGTTGASYEFPADCSASVWSDRQIIVKVPKDLAVGVYNLKINLASGVDLPASEPFTVNTSPLGPSICRLSPTTGRIGSQIQVWGEYFRNYDSALSRLRFSQNINATTSHWFYQSDNDFSSASSTVPSSSVSGPIRLVNSAGVSNGLNFRVGACQEDGDCQGQICCPGSSPAQGQCRTGLAECYGTSASCVYNWSFTTGSGNAGACPNNTVACGSHCCDSGQSCVNDACVDDTLLSCNDYHQCDGALYCPNSPGWCSGKTGSTIGAGCSDNDCRDLFDAQKIKLQDIEPKYWAEMNVCVDSKVECEPKKTVSFQLGINKVDYQLTCQNSSQDSFWTTVLTSGQCPPGSAGYGHWQLLAGNICQSDKRCAGCSSGLTCLSDKEQSYCGLDQKICTAGLTCKDGKCQKAANSCECCCDQKLNNSITGVNPGCCAPLTCSGTCGSGSSSDGKQFGVCSGCKKAGTSQDDHDAACNCSSSVGKYCDVSVNEGACRDCAQITSATDCASHATCCFDKKTNKCRGVVGNAKITSGSDAGACGYYTCDGQSCSDQLVASSSFATQVECQSKCRVVSLQGQSCDIASISTTTVNPYNNLPNLQQIGCGYQLCAAPLSCRTATGTSAASNNQADCGTCCCDPNNDKCQQLGAGLSCWANRGQCSGSGRGLCCGCQNDASCGNSQQTGCGQDTCCQARPILNDNSPKDGDSGVCRNASIKATFSQNMLAGSLPDNILLVADYGADQCPAGTRYLALGQTGQSSWWGKLQQRLLAWFKPAALASLPVPSNTYCAVDREISVSGRDVLIQPTSALAPNRRHFVVIVSDSNLDDNKALGVLSQAGIGLAGGQSLKFNNLQIASALQWSFTTGNQICRIDHVEINPTSVLLSDLLATSSLAATAIGANGQILAPNTNYAWSWSWSVGNPAVVQLSAGTTSQAVISPQNKKDADTYVRANAQVTIDQTGNSVGTAFHRDVPVKVFLCANPWPARQSDGSWQPWTDYATNMQFYYCRDSEAEAQASDLPGLKVVSSTDAMAINPAFYFFRYNPATTSPTNLSLLALSSGGAVKASWNAYPSSTGYKIYYGLHSGQYFSDPIVVQKDRTEATIGNLLNGQLYYFAISSVLRLDQTTFVETPLSPEVEIRPLDTTPPGRVRCFSKTAKANKLSLQWSRNNDDTVAYLVEYRASGSSSTGQSLTINQPVNGTTIKATINNLVNPDDVVVTVKAIDSAGNASNVQDSSEVGCMTVNNNNLEL